MTLAELEQILILLRTELGPRPFDAAASPIKDAYLILSGEYCKRLMDAHNKYEAIMGSNKPVSILHNL
jgi:hypothetical protein